MTEPKADPAPKTMTDEERILHALHVPPKKSPKEGAPFKIEVHWGKDRSIYNPTAGAILIWESGKRFHGGGDEKMYWCGYSGKQYTGSDSCGMPIRSEFFGQFHVVCPHCQRECFLDPETKRQFMTTKGLSETKKEGLARMPMVVGEKMFKATAKTVSLELTHIFRQLASHADVYMKYHRTDIRCRDIDRDTLKLKQYEKAREDRRDGLLIYPHARLMKDITAGASVESRMLAMCVA